MTGRRKGGQAVAHLRAGAVRIYGIGEELGSIPWFHAGRKAQNRNGMPTFLYLRAILALHFHSADVHFSERECSGAGVLQDLKGDAECN